MARSPGDAASHFDGPDDRQRRRVEPGRQLDRGGEPAGEQRLVKSDDVGLLAGKARQGLERLIAEYDDPATPYRALRRPGYSYDYDAYAQLARVAEWSAHVDEEASS